MKRFVVCAMIVTATMNDDTPQPTTRRPARKSGAQQDPKPMKKALTVRMNHDIQCYMYDNVALFRGDTYTYRGLFRRYGGLYSKEHKGYIVSHDRVSEVRSELTQMVSGFLVYNNRQKTLDITEEELRREFVKPTPQTTGYIHDSTSTRVHFEEENPC